MKKLIILAIYAIPAVLLTACLAPVKNAPHSKDQYPGMVEVPRGWFLMGSDAGEFNEQPLHEVFLETFFIDRYEVSAGEFAQFLNQRGNPEEKYFSESPTSSVITAETGGEEFRGEQGNAGNYLPREGFEMYPANNVSWYGAHAFCLWKGKRLPSEAEWEKAARGSDQREYPWGDRNPSADLARYGHAFEQDGLSVMLPVDSLPAGSSPYGVVNMAGNIWEWVDDWYRQNYCDFCDPKSEGYLRTAVEIAGRVNPDATAAEGTPAVPPRYGPKGPPVGSFKVIRGGAWDSDTGYSIRSTFRSWLDPLERYGNTGFRCVK